MNGQKISRYIIVFLVVIGTVLFCPINTYADNVIYKSDNTNVVKIKTKTNKNDLSAYSTDEEKCQYILGDPTKKNTPANLLQMIFNYIKVLGPILLIVFSSLDFTKTILTSDDEAMKKAQKKLGVRLICCVALYFLPTLVNLLLGMVGTSGGQLCGIK